MGRLLFVSDSVFTPSLRTLCCFFTMNSFPFNDDSNSMPTFEEYPLLDHALDLAETLHVPLVPECQSMDFILNDLKMTHPPSYSHNVPLHGSAPQFITIPESPLQASSHPAGGSTAPSPPNFYPDELNSSGCHDEPLMIEQFNQTDILEWQGSESAPMREPSISSAASIPKRGRPRKQITGKEDRQTMNKRTYARKYRQKVSGSFAPEVNFLCSYSRFCF